MASEATILENAPVTPAHTFAWRAFRGFVYGSPESPEQAVQQSGKENTVSPQRHFSPEKRISMAPNAPLLSPQKRKRDAPPQVSPTKSILRTPGAPTPRTKGLRDVNVKFKSISPEARSGPVSMSVPLVTAPEIAQLEQQVDKLWEELEQSLVEAKSPPRTKSEVLQVVPAEVKTKTKTSKKEAQAASAPAPAPATNTEKPSIDLGQEDYIRRTEKEVKRLLRQHKKLRDYAQRADEQNVRLYALVQDLQKENARLKGRLEMVDAAASSTRVAGEGLDSGENKHGERKREGKTATASMHSKSEPDSKVDKHSTADLGVSKTEVFKRSLRGDQNGFSNHEHGSRDRKAPVENRAQSQDKLPRTKRSSTSDLRLATIAAQKDAQELELRPLPASQSLRAPPSRTPIRSRSITTQASHEQQPTHRLKSETSPFSLTALAAQLEPTPAPKQPLASSSASASASAVPSTHTSSARHPSGPLNMAPDRVAAARLRLAKRSEERKASQTTYLMEAEMAGRGRSGDGRDGGGDGERRDEDSAVDWANI